MIGQMRGQMQGPAGRLYRLIAATSMVALVAGCTNGFDPDLRGGFGGFSTADAARAATASRPEPDSRGVISYPHYQVAVARRGDTVAMIAQRVGVSPEALAQQNGVQTGDIMNEGAVLVIPGRVAEPATANSDFAQMAGNAIDRAPGAVTVTTLPSSSGGTAPAPAAPAAGKEPVRHTVKRGETAYTISRLYNVSVRALADWNGLDSNFTLREGQTLLIPVIVATPAQDSQTTTAPGAGSPTPVPPSASEPLPAEQPTPVAQARQQAKSDAAAATPNLGTEQRPSNAQMGFPIQGRIIREYQKGKNDGIDLAANGGAPVKAAATGTVAAIIQDTDNESVIVVKHEGNLLTLYSNIEGIVVKKGDTVERGQQIAVLPAGNEAYLHFEVRKGLDTVDPMTYLQ